ASITFGKRKDWRLHGLTSDKKVMNLPGSLSLLRLDTGELDHFRPLVGLVGDELAEIGARHWLWHETQIDEPHIDLGVGERGVGLLVEEIEDLHRCVSGRSNALPPVRFIAGQ